MLAARAIVSGLSAGLLAVGVALTGALDWRDAATAGIAFTAPPMDAALPGL